MKIADYVATLREQVLAERKAEIEHYRATIQQKSLKERRNNGLAWYPVSIQKVGFTLGDKLSIVIENEQPEKSSRFRAGQVVKFYSNHPSETEPSVQGTIQYVMRNRKMKLMLNTGEVPHWFEKTPLIVELMYDEKTFEEMEKALTRLENNDNKLQTDLIKTVIGQSEAHPSPLAINLPALNPVQNNAVQQILGNQVLALVHGPPGTGKTTTLVQAVTVLAKTEKNILITAPSNAAVDLLALRLFEKQMNVVRIGNISRVEESVIDLTLDGKIAKHPDSKKIKRIKIEAAESRRLAKKFKRNFDAQARAERTELYQKAKELKDWAKQLEDRMVSEILSEAQVICTTLVGASHPVLKDFHFRTAIIDEAAQSLEAACWIPTLKAERLILAGDPYQLPPTVKSREAQKLGMEESLLEKLVHSQEKVVNLLTRQYRMHESIMAFSNAKFYENKLEADETVATQTIDGDDFPPLEFVDTAGCGFEEKQAARGKSLSNQDELNILREHLLQYTTKIRALTPPTFGFISPYKQQTILLDEMLQEEKLDGLDLTVNTIDGFQGQERDVIYISLVRSNEQGQIGFLKDYRRMNVAMTRAKKKLVVIGDSATIGPDPFFNQFIETVEKVGAYRTAWEFMM